MTRSKTTRLLIALAVVAFLAVMVTSSLGGSSSANHVMPDGQTMDGSSMPE